MIAVNNQLLGAYKKAGMNYILYDGVPFYKRLDVILFAIAIVLASSLIAFYKMPYFSTIYMIVYVLIIVGLMLVLNHFHKKLLSKRSIKVDPAKTKHWANEEYTKYRLDVFHNELLERKLLANTENDISTLLVLKEYAESESKHFYTKNMFVYGGSILLLFVASIWSELVKLFLTEAVKGDQIVPTLQFLSLILVLIYFASYCIYLLQTGLQEFLNSKSNTYTALARFIDLLRINLEIKYKAKFKVISVNR